MMALLLGIPLVLYTMSLASVGFKPTYLPENGPHKGAWKAERAVALTYQRDFRSHHDLIPDFGSLKGGIANRGAISCPDPSGPDVDTCILSNSKIFKAPADKQICDQILELGKVLGATQIVDSMGNRTPLDATASEQCATRLNSTPRSVGWGWFSPEFVVAGKSSAGTPFGLSVEREQDSPIFANVPSPTPMANPNDWLPETYKYMLATSSLINHPDIKAHGRNFTKGRTLVAAFLDTAAYYRRSNPDVDPFGTDFTKKLIAKFTDQFAFKGTMTPKAEADGHVYWIDVTNRDNFDICLNVGQPGQLGNDMWAWRHGKTPDPNFNSGLPGGTMELKGLGRKLTSVNDPHYFGDYVVGACPSS